jgi:hypothetical protein
MKSYRFIVTSITLVFLCLIGCKQESDGQGTVAKYKVDGPYVLYSGNKMRVVSVGKNHEINDRLYSVSSAPTLVIESERGNHRFDVVLKPVVVLQFQWAQPEKIFALSDPHGDFDSFAAILKAGKVINDKFEWVFGTNHLVVNGDAFDRGVDVLPILWLCYKLEKEAEEAGGRFHFIIGNHEDLVLAGDMRYAEDKYLSLARALKVEYKELFSENSELGRWLRSKNFIEVIGPYLFVHAGISESLINRNVSLEQLNSVMRQNIGTGKKNIPDQTGLAYFLFDSNGPLWYRGMFKDDEKYESFSLTTLNTIQQRFKASFVVVGHTIFDDISCFYEGGVIAINVENAKNRLAGKGRAILIEGEQVSVVFDSGETRVLKK